MILDAGSKIEFDAFIAGLHNLEWRDDGENVMVGPLSHILLVSS